MVGVCETGISDLLLSPSVEGGLIYLHLVSVIFHSMLMVGVCETGISDLL